jgi:cytoskeletal protein CcmA (bactofilin family)
LFTLKPKKMAKPIIQNEVKALNTIAKDTMIKGDIKSDGDIRIDGALEGNLECKGRVVLGPDARVKGTVRCRLADIMGNLEGEIFASELMTLKNTAVINGDLTMGKLSVEPGAQFTGKCTMGSGGSATSAPKAQSAPVQPESKPKENK